MNGTIDMPRALTPAEKRIKAISKKQNELDNGTNIMTSKEAKQAQDLGYLVADKPEKEISEQNNRGEEERHSHKQTAREDSDRTGTSRRRNSFAGTTQKLSVTKSIPGFHLHIFNDDGSRIEDAIAGGWTFVTPDEVGKTAPHVTSRNTDLGDKVRFLVGKNESGGPQYAYLMKIKEEWWLEDQQAIQIRNDQIDEAIRSGKNVKGESSDSFYIGKEGIKLSK